jgi:hypothetical protein
VFENRRWSIYPYIGGGFTGYSAAEKDIEENERLKRTGLNSFFTQAGAGIDLKILSGSYGVYPTLASPDCRLSLKYTYRMPRFERKDPSLSGSQHIITLSYGIGGRGRKRDL